MYTRILKVKLSTDTSLIYPIHECFLLTTYKNNNVSGITNIVNIDAIVRNGVINEQDIKITCTPLNHFNTVEGEIHHITAAIKNELDEQTSTIEKLNRYVDNWKEYYNNKKRWCCECFFRSSNARM